MLRVFAPDVLYRRTVLAAQAQHFALHILTPMEACLYLIISVL